MDQIIMGCSSIDVMLNLAGVDVRMLCNHMHPVLDVISCQRICNATYPMQPAV